MKIAFALKSKDTRGHGFFKILFSLHSTTEESKSKKKSKKTDPKKADPKKSDTKKSKKASVIKNKMEQEADSEAVPSTVEAIVEAEVANKNPSINAEEAENQLSSQQVYYY